EAGDMGGGRGVAGLGRPVEQAHHALDHEHVCAMCCFGGKRCDPMLAADPRVEVAGGAPGGEGVVAGIDEVGADLGRGHARPTPAQRRHQPGGDRGLADARMRAGDDDARPEPGHQNSMPFLPLMPRSYACLILRISVAVSARSTSSSAASRPVITTFVPSARPRMPATTSSTGTHSYFTA